MNTKDRSYLQEPAIQPLEFKDFQGGRGKTADGIPFSYHLYKSSDGVGVTTTVENHRSPASAQKALQRKIRTAIKMIERGPKLKNKAERIGERAVLTFALPDFHKEQAAVLWTNGQRLYYIESLSLKHALEFEKQFYR
ncbi:MAG: hypothetical protein ABR555_17105 [Pyrinomonadaceae bacterium]